MENIFIVPAMQHGCRAKPPLPGCNKKTAARKSICYLRKGLAILLSCSRCFFKWKKDLLEQFLQLLTTYPKSSELNSPAKRTTGSRYLICKDCQLSICMFRILCRFSKVKHQLFFQRKRSPYAQVQMHKGRGAIATAF